MTHKYRGCIAVLSINKSVEPNEEQKVLASNLDQEFTIKTSRQVFSSICIISRICCISVATDDFMDSWNALKSSVVTDGLVASGSSVPLVGILLLGG